MYLCFAHCVTLDASQDGKRKLEVNIAVGLIKQTVNQAHQDQRAF